MFLLCAAEILQLPFLSDRERALVDYNANINIVLLKHEYCIKHKQPKGQWQEHFIFRVNHNPTGARDSRSRRQFEEVPDNLSQECHKDCVTGQRDGRHELDEDRLEDPVMNVASQQSRWGRVCGYCYYTRLLAVLLCAFPSLLDLHIHKFTLIFEAQ